MPRCPAARTSCCSCPTSCAPTRSGASTTRGAARPTRPARAARRAVHECILPTPGVWSEPRVADDRVVSARGRPPDVDAPLATVGAEPARHHARRGLLRRRARPSRRRLRAGCHRGKLRFLRLSRGAGARFVGERHRDPRSPHPWVLFRVARREDRGRLRRGDDPHRRAVARRRTTGATTVAHVDRARVPASSVHRRRAVVLAPRSCTRSATDSATGRDRKTQVHGSAACRLRLGRPHARRPRRDRRHVLRDDEQGRLAVRSGRRRGGTRR